MYGAAVTFFGVLCLFAGAYALRSYVRVRALEQRIDAIQRRESDILEAVRVLNAAARESTRAVLSALDRTLRVFDSSLDAVLIFAPSGDDLHCVYAAGPRAENFEGVRVRRDGSGALPARAALCGHRIALTHNERPVIPTDRAALAVPMIAADGLAAVVYAASMQERIANPELLVRAVAQAAAPFALAADREADRAQATFDGLTGLYTPRAFRDKLRQMLTAAQASRNASLALWFVDTDRFKRVNDTLGHAAGDIVLQQMARLLQDHTLPLVDFAGRNGGDEFCALISNAHKVSAIERAKRFVDAVRACDFGVDIPVTASIGVAAYPYDAAEANELLEIADAAMYHSKRSGRDRVSFAVERSSFAVYE